MARRSSCTRAQARARLQQAEAFVLVAELVLGDETDLATPGVAAALAVLAGIAASDAACCARLRQRPSHYGVTLVDRSKARRLVGYARRMVGQAAEVVAG